MTFGLPDLEALKWVTYRGASPWHLLWTWSKDPLEEARLYATSWLLVHYLFNHERERFQRFQAGLAGASDAKILWNQLFPDLATPESFERTLDRYLEDGEYARYTASDSAAALQFHGTRDAGQ